MANTPQATLGDILQIARINIAQAKVERLMKAELEALARLTEAQAELAKLEAERR